MQILAIVQARFDSSRLPGKVLADIGGQPMLVRVVERASRAQTLDRVIVATTDQASDDPIAELCNERGYAFTRGSVHDVLDRFYQSARSYAADVVVRITADCPVIDAAIVDRTVMAFLGLPESDSERPRPASGQSLAEFLGHGPLSLPDQITDTRTEPTRPYSDLASGLSLDQLPYDFAANRLPPPWTRTYPIGLDVEVCTFQALEQAWMNAGEKHQREHVMPYLYEQEGRFRILLVNYEKNLGFLRWTVDTPQDLELLLRVYAHFGNRHDFSWLDVLDLFERQPELMNINADVPHNLYNQVDDRFASKS